MNKKIGKWITAGIVVIIAIVILFQCVVVVDPGQTGVIVTLGAVSDEVLTEGFHMKNPFIQSVVQMNNRTQKVESKGTAASKDLQTVTCETAVNYKVLNTASATLYKNVGVSYESTVITPAIMESIKAVTAQFTAEQLITARQQVSDQIRDLLQQKMSQFGISIEVFNIMNFDFSTEFNQAVEAKQTAEQQALKAQQDLGRIKIEAQQQVTQAQAQADSIKLVQEALNTSPQYIEYMKWQKWNGELPKVLAGSDAGTIIDVGDVTSSTSAPASATPAPTVAPVPSVLPSASPKESN
jgi:prohibitin 2